MALFSLGGTSNHSTLLLEGEVGKWTWRYSDSSVNSASAPPSHPFLLPSFTPIPNKARLPYHSDTFAPNPMSPCFSPLPFYRARAGRATRNSTRHGTVRPGPHEHDVSRGSREDSSIGGTESGVGRHS